MTKKIFFQIQSMQSNKCQLFKNNILTELSCICSFLLFFCDLLTSTWMSVQLAAFFYRRISVSLNYIHLHMTYDLLTLERQAKNATFLSNERLHGRFKKPLSAYDAIMFFHAIVNFHTTQINFIFGTKAIEHSFYTLVFL